MDTNYLDQIDAMGGRASFRENGRFPVSVSVANLTPIFNDMCFCTFSVDFQQQQFYFSKGMTDAIGLTEGEGILIPDFLCHLSGLDSTEAAQKYRDYFSAATSGKAGTISFQHSLCTAEVCTLRLEVHMQVVCEGTRKCIWGAVFDRTQTTGRHEVTDLPIRKKLIFDLEKIVQDRNVPSAAIIMIDIKEFHTYNDRFGRSAGDEILRGISDMITERLPVGGSLYHINIDHFCILWPHASRVQVDNFMAFLQEETANPIVVRDENIYAAYAMSAAIFPSSGCSADELLVNAEITLNKIKKDKRRQYSIFVPSDKRELTEKLDFESQLSKSIRNTNDNFLLYYQPLVDAQGEVLIGAEALLRWISPSKDIICPERVIAALEATGHMDGVGAWVLEEGIRQCSGWLREGINPDFVLHVNITAEDLMRPNYSLSVISLLSRYHMNPCNLILEITETSLMRSVSSCRQNLIRLRKAGVRISLDDFGTGYSSMNYLRELPVDEIKIDRSFLENIQRDRYNHSFISAMIILAHSISRTVCVEGIESCGEADTVRALHADVFQGFFFGRPVSASEFESRYLKKLKICN